MLLLGSRGREVDAGTGEFYCPACGDMRPYKRRRIGRYFTVYFLPVFQIEKLAEWLQCDVCMNQFPVEVLQRKPPPNPQRILEEVKKDLDSGMSVQQIQIKLVNSGLHVDLMHKVIDVVIGDRRMTCPKCSYEYLDSATFCSNCGTRLKSE
ncbi:MAG TPA: zinc-ribbon domain-containing protein [Anaerolineae bacterium]